VAINTARWRQEVVRHHRRPSVNAPFVAMLVAVAVWAVLILALLFYPW
jgi:hypothetical protein